MVKKLFLHESSCIGSNLCSLQMGLKWKGVNEDRVLNENNLYVAFAIWRNGKVTFDEV